jgi:hypothetical protein
MSRRSTWAVLAAVHLCLVIWGATQFRLPPDNPLMRAFDIYGTLSGANTGYGFFAPEIGSELRARFEIEDSAGRTFTDTLQRGVNRETALRINNIIGTITERMEKPAERRRLAASWAGKMFARHPDARQVAVILESYDLPSLERYRAGDRTGWSPFYRAVFSRRSPVGG